MSTATPGSSIVPFAELPRAHGEPLGDGRLRTEPGDFAVDELLGFAPDGEGDHRLLQVRKTNANTEWVARRLAQLTGVSQSEVGYAGLKDRHAITTQWISMPRPREGEPDWGALAGPLAEDGIEILEVHAHRRKLRRGSLVGNRFRIKVRDFAPDPDIVEQRVVQIRARGVPNYFGEQRFGRGGANLARADALFRGAIRRPSRHQRGLWLSAARSELFNRVLAARVRTGDWERPLPGDCLNLQGTRSFFPAADIDDTLVARCAELDLHPTGPLWGAGELPTGAQVRTLEAGVGEGFPGWAAGLARFDLRQERRALRLPVPSLTWQCGADGTATEFAFDLPAGTYATALLRELVRWGLEAEDQVDSE